MNTTAIAYHQDSASLIQVLAACNIGHAHKCRSSTSKLGNNCNNAYSGVIGYLGTS